LGLRLLFSIIALRAIYLIPLKILLVPVFLEPALNLP